MTGALGTLGVLTEISLKCVPLPKVEATRVLECSADDAIRLTNEWGGKPLPVSATCHHAGRLAVRLSGAAPAVEAAARQIGGNASSPTAKPSGKAFASRRMRSSPRRARAARRSGGFRSRRRRRTPDLGGEQMIEWGGALRWLVAGERTEPREGARLGPRPRRSRDAVSRRRQVRRRVSSAAGRRCTRCIAA